MQISLLRVRASAGSNVGIVADLSRGTVKPFRDVQSASWRNDREWVSTDSLAGLLVAMLPTTKLA